MRYIQLDSSQISRIGSQGNIAEWLKARFLGQDARLFVTWHQLFEIAGTESYEAFRGRLDALRQVDTVYSLNIDQPGELGSIVDLQLVEMRELLKQRPVSIERLTLAVEDEIHPIELSKYIPSSEALYKYAKLHGVREATLSLTNPYIINKHYTKKMSELKGHVFDPSRDESAKATLEDYGNLLVDRRAPKDRADNVINVLKAGVSERKNEFMSYANPWKMIETMVGEQVDPNLQLSHYLRKLDFKTKMRHFADRLHVDNAATSAIDINDTILMNLISELTDTLYRELSRDNSRPFEPGNATDIKLAAYSLFMTTYVDKRTFDLANRVSNRCSYRLRMMKVEY